MQTISATRRSRKIQKPHPSTKREGMRRPKSFKSVYHPPVQIAFKPVLPADIWKGDLYPVR
jgi:hypothetical protein